MLVPCAVDKRQGENTHLASLLPTASGVGGGGCGLCQGTATPAGEKRGARGLGSLGEPGLILTLCWDLGFFENLMKAPYPQKNAWTIWYVQFQGVHSLP